MYKTDHRKGSINRWDSIIVYNDEKKTIKEYKHNEEQLLLIPIKVTRRKHKQKSSSKNEQKNELKNEIEDNDLKEKSVDNQFQLGYVHQEIFSRKGCISDSINALWQPSHEES